MPDPKGAPGAGARGRHARTAGRVPRGGAPAGGTDPTCVGTRADPQRHKPAQPDAPLGRTRRQRQQPGQSAGHPTGSGPRRHAGHRRALCSAREQERPAAIQQLQLSLLCPLQAVRGKSIPAQAPAAHGPSPAEGYSQENTRQIPLPMTSANATRAGTAMGSRSVPAGHQGWPPRLEEAFSSKTARPHSAKCPSRCDGHRELGLTPPGLRGLGYSTCKGFP